MVSGDEAFEICEDFRRQHLGVSTRLASSAQWYSYTQILAETRGQGVPDARWALYRGRADNVASHGHDFLFSPVRFQVISD